MRIMVVEDDADLAKALTEFLSEIGHEVELVNNAPRALRIIDALQPDVVLVDIMLPVFDGNLVATEIRRTAAHPPRLVAMTGKQAAVVPDLFDDFLPKPFFPDDILRVLGEQRSPLVPSGSAPADGDEVVTGDEAVTDDDLEDTAP